MTADKMNLKKRQQHALGFTAMLLGGLALIVPLWPEFAPEWRIGGLLVLAGLHRDLPRFPTFQRLLAPRRVVRGRHHSGDGPPAHEPAGPRSRRSSPTS